MAETYFLHNWSMRYRHDNPYLAPELNPVCLVGFRDDEVKRIITSPIVAIDRKRITTKSGSIYILGDIDLEYLDWMKENNLPYDPENPIKIKNAF